MHGDCLLLADSCWFRAEAVGPILSSMAGRFPDHQPDSWADEFGDEDNPDLPPQPPPPSVKGQGRGRGRGSGKQRQSRVREPKEPCLVEQCEEARYQGLRFCKTHKRSYDSMAYQALKAEEDGEEGAVEAFQNAMAKDSTASVEVTKFAKINPPDARYARKQFIDWAAFRQTHGQRSSKIDRSKCAPFTEGEFKRWAMNVKALTKEEANEWWQEHLDNPLIDRDNAGFRGRQQLWIPKSKARIDQNERYVDNAAEQGCKPIKTPKEKDLAMMQDHVKRQGLSISDAFLTQASDTSPHKRAGSSALFPAPSPKRQAVQVDIPRETPKFYAQMDKDFKAICKAMDLCTTKVEKAIIAYKNYDAKKVLHDFAMIAILRNMQFRCHLVQRWKSSQTEPTHDFFGPLKMAIDASPDGITKAIVDLVQNEGSDRTRFQGLGMAQFLTDNKDRLPFTGEPLHFKSQTEMEAFKNRTDEIRSSEEFLELQKNWKQICEACTTVAASTSTIACDLVTHMKTRDAEQKRQVARKEQEKQQTQLREVRDNARRAAEEIKKKNKPTAPKLNILSADLVGLPTVKVMQGDIEPSDWSEPFCCQKNEKMQLCMGDQALQKAFTSWATQYKKPTEQNDGSGRHQYPLQTKYGKDAPEELFKQLGIPNVLDISVVPGGPTFMNSVWLFGYDTDMETVGFYPNNAAQIKIHVLGEVTCVIFDVASVVDYLTKLEPSRGQLTYLDFTKIIGDLDAETLKTWSAAQVRFSTHCAKAGDLLYIPAGWCGMEKTSPGHGLNYGIRKSFFRVSEQDFKSFSACKAIMEYSQRNVARMSSIQNLMQEKLASVTPKQEPVEAVEPGAVEPNSVEGVGAEGGRALWNAFPEAQQDEAQHSTD